MNIYEQKAFFLEKLTLLSKIDNFEIENSNSYAQSLDFLDHTNDYLLNNIKNPQMILSSVFKKYSSLNLPNLIDALSNVIQPYWKAIGLEFDFEHMTWDEKHKVGMKKDYTTATDVNFYCIKFVDYAEDGTTTVFSMKFYVEPMQAYYEVTNNFKVSHDVWTEIGVYYKDLNSIIKPMLSAYNEQLSKTLTYSVDTVDDGVIEVLNMLKIN